MLVTWKYRQRNSLMEQIDPRARWIFSLLFLFSVTFFWDARFLLFFFVIAVLWFIASGVSFYESRAGWRLVLILLFFMIVVNTILTGGGAGGVVPPGGTLAFPDGIPLPFTDRVIHFGLTYERIWFAITQVMRILSISGMFLIIPYSMDPRLYGVTFRGIGLGDKIAFSLELAFRYVPTLARDFQTTLDAQKARGYELERLKGGLLGQARKFVPLLIPVTMNSILSGEDITNAMDLRVFATRPRTWVYQLTYHWWDYALIVFGVALLVASIVLRYGFKLGGFWVPAWFFPG
jgi:energy-coupling factor transport system permease protein